MNTSERIHITNLEDQGLTFRQHVNEKQQRRIRFVKFNERKKTILLIILMMEKPIRLQRSRL